jgi:hypothetical protein
LIPHVVAAAQAIAHAHERGIVHRDIKPSNILVGDLGETVVIDWGLAKALDEADEPHEPISRGSRENLTDSLQTRPGLVFGTPGFMAPEQLRGKPVGERCDVYALGATLYHLLACRPPHYAKNGDDMMEAAALGPPTPLAELVDGVPPELITIVDKALAYEPNRRYPHASALAEDLRRFLTGQLVAAHVYSPRDKLVRFARKHRASVAIAAGALAVLATVAVVLVQRIRNERDRADEQARIAMHEKRVAEGEREAVLDSSRQLVLTNARYTASVDPTRAVAMVKPLVDSVHWRAARDVAAAASVHGVAYGMAASPHTLTLELSRDGQRALAAGDDGVVRIYDLAKRESRVIADTKGAVMARFGDGERKVVLFQGNRLTIVDTASGDKTDVTAPTAIAQLEVAGPIAYWVDPANAVWKLDLAGTTPVRLDVGELVRALAPSPDGRWIALAGKEHLLLVDRSSPTLPPEIIAAGPTKTMTWSAASDHLIALTADEVIDIRLAPSPQIARRITVGQRFSAAYSGGRIYSAGPTGIAVVEPHGTKLRAEGPEHTLGVHEGPNRVVIAPKPRGDIVVLSERGDHTLRGPAPIERVATSVHGPWIVAAAANRLLLWSLDAREPHVVSKRSPSSARFVTADHVLVTYFAEPAEWIDLRKRSTVQLGMLAAIEKVASAPGSNEAIVIDGARRAWRVAAAGPPQPLDGEVSAAIFVDDHRIVLADAGGIRLEDSQQRIKLALYARSVAVKSLAATAAGGGWVAAAFEDGMLWREHLATNKAAELQLVPGKGAQPLAITDDGSVLYVQGDALHMWWRDGRAGAIAKPTGSVLATSLVEVPDRDQGRHIRVLALGDTGTFHVQPDGATEPNPMPVLGASAALARTGGLIAAPTADGGVEIVDPVVGWRWPLATPGKGQAPFSMIDIAPDGSRVLASNATDVFVWSLGLPDDMESTKAWLARLSNATSDNPSVPLGWD